MPFQLGVFRIGQIRKDPKDDAITLELERATALFTFDPWEGLMRDIRQSMAVLVLAVLGMGGCAPESHVATGSNLADVADTKATMRALWAGHIFWIRNVVLDNATSNPAARDIAEKEVVANAKQIASTISPFYGEAASEKLFTLLAGHYAAVKEYSDATVAGNKLLQEAALVRLSVQRR